MTDRSAGQSPAHSANPSLNQFFACATHGHHGRYDRITAKPMTESNIMRALWMLLGLCLIPAMSRGDVVVYDQNATNTTYILNQTSETYGQAFTNTAGNVAVKSITFFLTQASGTVSGNLSVDVYLSTGGSASYTPQGGVVVSSVSQAFAVGQNTFNFTSGTALNANATYVAVLNLSGISNIATNNIGVQTNTLSGSLNGAFTLDSGANWTAEAYQIKGSVVMVPEPGTLLLGGIAAACGGGGAWWRRRRRQAKEVAVADPAA